MAAPDIILGRGEVLVTNGSSALGMISPDNKISFGVVQAVSDVTNSFIVGDYVCYKTELGRKIMYGSTIYIILTEDNISGSEVIPP